MIFAQVLQVTWMKTFDRKRVLRLQSKYVNIVFFWRENENVFFFQRWKYTNRMRVGFRYHGFIWFRPFWLKALTWSRWDTTVAKLIHWQIASNLTDVYVSPAVSTWQITSECRHTTDVCKVLHICSAKVHHHLVISGLLFFFYHVSVSRCCTTWH